MEGEEGQKSVTYYLNDPNVFVKSQTDFKTKFYQ